MNAAHNPEAFADLGQVALIRVDREGVIQGWNLGAQLLFGHPAAAALGRKVDVIIPETYHAQHWAGFHRAMKGPWRGSEAWGPIEGLHQSGQMLSLEVLLVGLADGQGAMQGVLALFRPPATP
jgi:PAS domain S-box-containing protein